MLMDPNAFNIGAPVAPSGDVYSSNNQYDYVLDPNEQSKKMKFDPSPSILTNNSPPFSNIGKV